jgi:malonyl-CoA/methylmalonyl-CoA synthetase
VEGELPKGGTGKVQKKVLGPQFFPPGYEGIPEVQVWRNRKQGQVQVRL